MHSSPGADILKPIMDVLQRKDQDVEPPLEHVARMTRALPQDEGHALAISSPLRRRLRGGFQRGRALRANCAAGPRTTRAPTSSAATLWRRFGRENQVRGVPTRHARSSKSAFPTCPRRSCSVRKSGERCVVKNLPECEGVSKFELPSARKTCVLRGGKLAPLAGSGDFRFAEVGTGWWIMAKLIHVRAFFDVAGIVASCPQLAEFFGHPSASWSFGHFFILVDTHSQKLNLCFCFCSRFCFCVCVCVLRGARRRSVHCA